MSERTVIAASVNVIRRLEKENRALRSQLAIKDKALADLSNMYSHAWDLVDGGLMMMPDSIPKFEDAHAAARKALDFNDIELDEALTTGGTDGAV